MIPAGQVVDGKSRHCLQPGTQLACHRQIQPAEQQACLSSRRRRTAGRTRGSGAAAAAGRRRACGIRAPCRQRGKHAWARLGAAGQHHVSRHKFRPAAGPEAELCPAGWGLPVSPSPDGQPPSLTGRLRSWSLAPRAGGPAPWLTPPPPAHPPRPCAGEVQRRRQCRPCGVRGRRAGQWRSPPASRPRARPP